MPFKKKYNQLLNKELKEEQYRQYNKNWRKVNNTRIKTRMKIKKLFREVIQYGNIA